MAAVARAALRAAPGEAARAAAAAAAGPPVAGTAEPVLPAAPAPPAAPPGAPEEPAAAVPKAGPEPAGASGAAATVRAPWRPGRRTLAGAAAVLAVAGLLAGARAVLGGGPAPPSHRPASAHWPVNLFGPVYTRPYAIGGRIYMGDHNGHVYVLNAFTGAVLWRYPRKGQPALAPVDSRPGVADHKVYVASSNGHDGHVYALDAANGKSSGATRGPVTCLAPRPARCSSTGWSSSAAATGYTPSTPGTARTTSRRSGWRARSSSPACWPTTRPTRAHRCGSGPSTCGAGRYLYALNPANGQVRWRHCWAARPPRCRRCPRTAAPCSWTADGTLYALRYQRWPGSEWSYTVQRPGPVPARRGQRRGVRGHRRLGVRADHGPRPAGLGLAGQPARAGVWPGRGVRHRVRRQRLPDVLPGRQDGRKCGQWPRPFRADDLVATPVLANSRIYVGTRGGHVYAVSVRTGTM